MRTPNEKRIVKKMRQWIVYEDEHFVVLNKPEGLAAQGGSMATESLDRYLPSLAESLDGHDEHKALRLDHRLDKETSGVLVLTRPVLLLPSFQFCCNVVSSTSRTKRSSRRQRQHLCTRTGG
ncbi:hypothetical protein PsorP6_009915 [Peronosclerospora sorghi]|uniref:Uncharacterized protein n=1 Tax=Peronosclerospora sorghi TaxID=230839 RepID=A0ACC0VZ73_9STRA|nr:hypothetical protein PsorP6_009915 [Peronosclerospora sorghi]